MERLLIIYKVRRVQLVRLWARIQFLCWFLATGLSVQQAICMGIDGG
jgi:hypothetical protein